MRTLTNSALLEPGNETRVTDRPEFSSAESLLPGLKWGLRDDKFRGVTNPPTCILGPLRFLHGIT